MRILFAITLLFVFPPLFGACNRVERIPQPVGTVRIAQYNIFELTTEKLIEVDASGRGANPQVIAAARVIQRVRPDILVINEIDHDYSRLEDGLSLNARRFIDNYLAHGPAPISYPHLYTAPCNTGILSGADFDNDGRAATDADRGTREHGNDSFGFGLYPGQYSMAILSRHPIDTNNVRTFQKFRWKDLPDNHIPPDYYSPAALEVFRLSSKSHWDVPVSIHGRIIHLLCSHPTPQGFDGPEDRNGRRNWDEIAFWRHYLDNHPALVDDNGTSGGLSPTATFMIVGDLNAEPHTGSMYRNLYAIQQLLQHPRVRDTGPLLTSPGALRGQATAGPPNHREQGTFGWANPRRIDYLLPNPELPLAGGGVFWPAATEDLHGALLAEYGSDHRLIWLDVLP